MYHYSYPNSNSAPHSGQFLPISPTPNTLMKKVCQSVYLQLGQCIWTVLPSVSNIAVLPAKGPLVILTSLKLVTCPPILQVLEFACLNVGKMQTFQFPVLVL